MSTQVDEGLDTRTDLAQDEAALFLLGAEMEMEDLPCENQHHDTLPDFHEGPGKVYVSVGHLECGHREGRVVLFCEKYFNCLKSSNTAFSCVGCKKVGRLGDFVLEVGRR